MEHEDSTYCYYSGLPSPMAYMERVKKATPTPAPEAIDRIIEMAREDRTTFDVIKFQFGLNEADVKALMKKQF